MNDASLDLGAALIITVFVCLILDGLRGMVNEHRARKAERLAANTSLQAALLRYFDEQEAAANADDCFGVRQLIEDAHSIPPPLPDLSGRTPDAWPL